MYRSPARTLPGPERLRTGLLFERSPILVLFGVVLIEIGVLALCLGSHDISGGGIALLTAGAFSVVSWARGIGRCTFVVDHAARELRIERRAGFTKASVERFRLADVRAPRIDVTRKGRSRRYQLVIELAGDGKLVAFPQYLPYATLRELRTKLAGMLEPPLS